MEKSLRQTTLENRYFLKNEKGECIEDYERMCNRVANALSNNNQEYEYFYEVMYNCDFLPNSPTLMSAGVNDDFMLSACSVVPLEDSMESIFDAVKTSAIISKMGGGCGFDFSVLRPKDSLVGSTQGIASGPLSFINVFNSATEVIKQGCFIGSTLVRTVHGAKPIKDLKKGDKIYCWDGKYKIKECTDSWLTHKNAEVWKLTTEKGLEFYATPNHPFMVRNSGYGKNKEYIKLKDLKPGMALMPLTLYDKKKERMITLHDGKDTRLPEQYFIAKELNWNIKENEIIHHKDGNHFNNNINNLEIKCKINHISDHDKERYENGEHPFLSLTQEHVKFKMKKGRIANSIWKIINQGKEVNEHNWEEQCKSLYNTQRFTLNHIKEIFGSFDEALKYANDRNDKVLSVEFSHYEDVYNVEVPDVNNFTICRQDGMKGLIVSNSRRRGANMGILKIDHPDIEEFIDAKLEQGRFTNFNFSVAITDKFMKAVKENLYFDLVFKGQFYKSIQARKLWSKIVENAHKNGEPGIFFIDTVNKSNLLEPLLGNMKACNPCGEIPLYSNELCVLGSINLSNMYKNDNSKWIEASRCVDIDEVIQNIDFDKLRKTIETGVLMLDNIIDKQKYPNKQFEETHKANRKIGLGVMGFADLLIKLGVVYGSKLSYEVADMLMRCVKDQADYMSEALGKEKGFFPNLALLNEKIGRDLNKIEEFYKKYNFKPRRNTAITGIAPTGTLSLIAECSSGIEPNFDFEVVHNRMDDNYVTYHPLVVEYKEQYEWDVALPNEFITASKVKPEQHIKMQATFQKYVDSAISKTINLPNEATVDDVKIAYELAYKLGCKGVTVYRDGSRDNQVLSTTDKKNITNDEFYESTDEPPILKPKDFEDFSKREEIKLPDVMEAMRVKVNTPEGKIFINISHINNIPYEIFIHHPANTSHAETYESLARLISTCLRNGVEIEEVIDQLEKSHKKYGSVSGINNALIKALKRFDGEKAEVPTVNIEIPVTKYLQCPECMLHTVVMEEGCQKCFHCGYSACN